VNFARVLKEVLWCLATEGGISYRRIKLSYGLDDDAVEELRRELISIKRLAADVEGERLVWAPEGLPSRSEAVTATHQPLPPSRAPEPSFAASLSKLPLTRELPGAARRQLKVMFCDLADSTHLSAQLDPEEMGDVIRAYQELVSEAVRGFDGFIAKFMGDGVLVYFGYPHAQGNDAERAVHSGLAILAAVPTLNQKVGRNNGIRLAVRIGIATGLVVVGETIGEGAAREQTVVGETPNLAARLQGLAGPDTILISAATHNIVSAVFACEELGAHALKGIAEPVQVWRVSGLREADDVEFDTAASDFPLVGRDEEIGLLRRAWQQTKEEGHGQVVFISGEPGIGKSSLVDVLRRAAREEGLAGWQAADDSKARFAKLERLLSGYKSYSRELVLLFAALDVRAIALTLPS
jgi:class 3 adenylate cyclase